MAELGTVKVPIFARFNGEEIEIGTLEIPFRASLDMSPTAPRMTVVVNTTGDPAARACEISRRLTVAGGA